MQTKQTESAIENIVIVGTFEPTTFDKYFFISKQFVLEQDILEDSKFESSLAHLSTKNFKILILPNQIILTINPDSSQNNWSDIILNLLKVNENNKITAMGINLHFHKILTKETLSEVTKNYFYRDNVSVFSKHFKTDDSVYGVYASKTVKDARLKLDIKPNIITNIKNPLDIKYSLAFAFNFHFEFLEINAISKITLILNDYNFYKNESKDIYSTYNWYMYNDDNIIEYVDQTEITKVWEYTPFLKEGELFRNFEILSKFSSFQSTSIFVNLERFNNINNYHLRQLKSEFFLIELIRNFLRKDNLNDLLEDLENEEITEEEFEATVSNDENKYVITLRSLENSDDYQIIQELMMKIGNDIRNLSMSEVSELFSVKHDELILSYEKLSNRLK